jgi:hypothetical protein
MAITEATRPAFWVQLAESTHPIHHTAAPKNEVPA